MDFASSSLNFHNFLQKNIHISKQYLQISTTFCKICKHVLQVSMIFYGMLFFKWTRSFNVPSAKPFPEWLRNAEQCRHCSGFFESLGKMCIECGKSYMHYHDFPNLENSEDPESNLQCGICNKKNWHHWWWTIRNVLVSSV